MTEPSQKEAYKFVKAAGNGDIEAIMDFLDQFPASIEVKSSKSGGYTALLWAAQRNKVDAITLLVEKGADFDVKDSIGLTLLMYAAIDGNKDIVELLLEKGADINEKCISGKTAAWHALNAGNDEIATMLEQWPEKQRAAQEKKCRQWLEETDFSKGLNRAIPATRPFKSTQKPRL